MCKLFAPAGDVGLLRKLLWLLQPAHQARDLPEAAQLEAALAACCILPGVATALVQPRGQAAQEELIQAASGVLQAVLSQRVHENARAPDHAAVSAAAASG